MLNFDKYIIKEGIRFFADFEECDCEDSVPMIDGDVIKFNFDDKRYIGTLNKIGTEKNLFEIFKIRESIKK